MYAYIDESGDEGIGGKGTKWFVITTLIASQEEATTLGQTCRRIKQRINLDTNKVLHWSELSHSRKKAVPFSLTIYEPGFKVEVPITFRAKMPTSADNIHCCKLSYASLPLFLG